MGEAKRRRKVRDNRTNIEKYLDQRARRLGVSVEAYRKMLRDTAVAEGLEMAGEEAARLGCTVEELLEAYQRVRDSERELPKSQKH